MSTIASAQDTEQMPMDDMMSEDNNEHMAEPTEGAAMDKETRQTEKPEGAMDSPMPKGTGTVPEGAKQKGEPTLYDAESQPEAAEDKGKPESAEEKGKPEAVAAGKDVESEEGMPKGLSVALTRVKNENARARLEQNLAAFNERYQARMDKMQDVEVESVDEETGEVTIKASEPVKYLGFIKGHATKRYSVNAEGAISEHAPWYSFLYAEDNS